MRRFFLAATAAALAACSDGTGSSVATSVVVSPASVALDAVGATRVVRAAVADQNGKPMQGAALRWSSSAASVTVVSAGGDSAVVTAVGNGAATVTAAAGEASGAASVQVAQVATSITKAGDAQTGAAGAPLPEPLRVEVRDRLGAPVAGVTVGFAVTLGGGSVSAPTAVTSADGVVAVSWTLGTTTGTTQQVVASAPGVASTSFSATPVAGPPAMATAVAGDGQVAASGTPVAVAPRLRVVDAYENSVTGLAVEFTVTAGGGSVAGGSQTTDGGGTAAPTSWTLGPAAGTNTLTASFPGTALPAVVFTASSGTAGSLVRAAGDNQAAMAGTAVPTAPRVVVRDGGGAPLPGVTVVFAVTGGGGSLSGAAATTDATGTATLGGWTLGPAAEPNTLTATAQGIAAPPVSFRATGCTGGGAGYAMTLCFTAPVSPSQRAAYESAAARWSEIIRGDLPDIPMNVPAGSCGAGTPSLNMTVDDLVIFASVENIDGPGQILGQAGWCYRRTGGLPLVGIMRFDAADVAGLESSGRFVDVVLHEMGHVLGLSAGLWNTLGLLKDPSTTETALDTYFDGAGAIAAFDAVGGTAYGGGRKVPVENTGGPGTMNSHWRESVLGNELMTGFLNQGSNPLSIVTVRALADMGYTVDVSAADAYTLGSALRADGRAGPVLHLHRDEYEGPRYTVDRTGRRTLVRP